MAARLSLREVMARLGRSNAELASAEREQLSVGSGADTIGGSTDRQRVTIRGSIEVLNVQPRQDTPWLEAEVSDGTGHLKVVWMGRRDIPGIDAGRELVLKGRISCVDNERRMYNPHYTLL